MNPVNRNAQHKTQKPQMEPHTRRSGCVVILRFSSKPTTPPPKHSNQDPRPRRKRPATPRKNTRELQLRRNSPHLTSELRENGPDYTPAAAGVWSSKILLLPERVHAQKPPSPPEPCTKNRRWGDLTPAKWKTEPKLCGRPWYRVITHTPAEAGVWYYKPSPQYHTSQVGRYHTLPKQSLYGQYHTR
ncbi:hypothetical protein BS47DRAFT_1369301 [Hydnum rufescens UP504]|uniref:Uncharacterized protein n=1 Tax=Hydnum rufescens UP504 TaxID=1448309 RepID=A0A9P6DH68_9AGAM|nr:hypothetical protein BS47DRAFT_1369301 [Hydnum rufescens UP504]